MCSSDLDGGGAPFPMGCSPPPAPCPSPQAGPPPPTPPPPSPCGIFHGAPYRLCCLRTKDVLGTAADQIASNKLRSFFTLLGIIVSVWLDPAVLKEKIDYQVLFETHRAATAKAIAKAIAQVRKAAGKKGGKGT